MLVEDTPIEGLKTIVPQIWEDDRGYFFESYQERRFMEAGIPVDFIQDNQAFSKKYVLRGLHYQLPPHAQAKLVRVVYGTVLDVVVDIRENSRTYGEHFALELSAENHKQMYIPHGLAHGYLTLSDSAIFVYKCDAYYAREQEAGIDPWDPKINIDWGISKEECILSEKDANLPGFGKHKIFHL